MKSYTQHSVHSLEVQHSTQNPYPHCVVHMYSRTHAHTEAPCALSPCPGVQCTDATSSGCTTGPVTAAEVYQVRSVAMAPVVDMHDVI